jgi:hypothetical protein
LADLQIFEIELRDFLVHDAATSLSKYRFRCD